MTKVRAGILAVIVAGLAITATVQYKGKRQLREQNEALRQQNTSLAAENKTLSNRLPREGAMPLVSDEQYRELLRLRGEIVMLRASTNFVVLKEENRRLQASAQAHEELLRFRETESRMINTGKQLGLGMRMWANDHEDVFATNCALLSNILPNLPQESLDAFELVNVGLAESTFPFAIIARERTPRRNPEGGWQRAYVLCDGSVQRVSSPDGNFNGWEQPNDKQILELRRPITSGPNP